MLDFFTDPNDDGTSLEILLRRVRHARRTAREQIEGRHCTSEEVVRLQEGTLPAEGVAFVKRHISSCESCKERFPGVSTAFATPLTADADAGIATIFTAYYAWLASLDTRIVGRVREILDAAAAMLEDEAPVPVLASAPPSSPAWRVIAPIASRIRPGFTFVWPALGGAAEYYFELYDAGAPNKPLQWAKIDATGLGPVRYDGVDYGSLVTGRNYLWSVRALDGQRKNLDYSGLISFELAGATPVPFDTMPDMDVVKRALVLAGHGLDAEALAALETTGLNDERRRAAVASRIVKGIVQGGRVRPEDRLQLDRALVYWKGHLR